MHPGVFKCRLLLLHQPKHTWDMHIIAIWNTEGRNCLNACNINSLKGLAKEISEANPQGPQDKNSTMDPPQSSDKATQHRSSPNLIRKVQDWREWTYTDGSLKEHKEGQDTGSGVYYPCFNVSHHVNPRGVAGITNTISRAELAAIAAAIIHGYSHITTDSLTSMYEIKKRLSHPNRISPVGGCPVLCVVHNITRKGRC